MVRATASISISPRRPLTATARPSSAKRRAIALPRPRELPLTSATVCSTDRMWTMFSRCSLMTTLVSGQGRDRKLENSIVDIVRRHLDPAASSHVARRNEVRRERHSASSPTAGRSPRRAGCSSPSRHGRKGRETPAMVQRLIETGGDAWTDSRGASARPSRAKPSRIRATSTVGSPIGSRRDAGSNQRRCGHLH
jgi:hypothetical protein